MCIGMPCEVIENSGMWGTVDYCGNRMEVMMTLVPKAVPGSWVLVHAGLAIQQIDLQEAEETLALLKELEGHE
ncbi:HypC/HybG/HupF family hydrogenase formation chaperone [Dethiobacter alkaliphilus]|uniref:HypC/HybG/HupF family hydrogenase formation chaperone n=1 Tax=Dethiobacter alkaliphilus TaxID=427926 RepID=UPI002225EC03|nr:HypC/HybG/HupF family hydrogenase formation chaperone [Dethiobacter alkaliphilus]MCW3490328.1 HypC/HybG/HupF family hydrogenase formation chaperone [Dethiobacter alkaliphilus]